MDDLVERLSTGDHPVAVGGPTPTLEELQHRLDDIGHVFVKFTGTRGGTDLGIPVDRATTDVSGADFEKGSGTVHVEGTLILNDEPVRVVADIDLATLKGTGHLVVVDESEVVDA
jgi:Core binding factor beta subunit